MQNKAKHIKAVVFHLEGTLIEAYKQDATTEKKPTPSPDAEAVLGYLRSRDLRLAIVSHGSLESVQKMLSNISYIILSDFDTVICREGLQAQNPDINAVALAAKKMNLPLRHVMVVAAEPAILQDARKAGALTMFLTRRHNPRRPGSGLIFRYHS